MDERWISVEDELPAPYETVLVWLNAPYHGYEGLDVALLMDADNRVWSDGVTRYYDWVTHWRPAPAPPREFQEE